jgi:hypothetical protein
MSSPARETRVRYSNVLDLKCLQILAETEMGKPELAQKAVHCDYFVRR